MQVVSIGMLAQGLQYVKVSLESSILNVAFRNILKRGNEAKQFYVRLTFHEERVIFRPKSKVFESIIIAKLTLSQAS